MVFVQFENPTNRTELAKLLGWKQFETTTGLLKSKLYFSANYNRDENFVGSFLDILVPKLLSQPESEQEKFLTVWKETNLDKDVIFALPWRTKLSPVENFYLKLAWRIVWYDRFTPQELAKEISKELTEFKL